MALAKQLDLDAYFARIGYAGTRDPTLSTLNGIIGAHVRSIPFENLSVLLGEPISLDSAALEAKLVRARRGGYCFEQNTLLLHVLEALGFQVTAHAGRARYQRTLRYELPRTHMFLRVELPERAYLVDVGFGGLSPTAALALVPGEVQSTPHESRRLVPLGVWSGAELRGADAVLIHQAELAGGFQDLYEFNLDTMPESDRHMGNWYTSTHPSSHFRASLMVARASGSARITLQNDQLSFRDREGRVEKRTLTSHAEIAAALAEHFGLCFAASTRFACPPLAALP